MSPAHTSKTVGREDLWKIANCQFEDLKFADQKAIALLGIADVLAAVVAAVLSNSFKDTKAAAPWIRILLAIIIVGIACALIATYFAMRAIDPRGKVVAKKPFPRTFKACMKAIQARMKAIRAPPTLEALRQQNNTDLPLTYWEGIASFKGSIDYLAALRALDGHEIDRQVANDIHRMAGVAFEKYKWISRALFWAKFEFLTFLLAIIALMVRRLLLA